MKTAVASLPTKGWAMLALTSAVVAVGATKAATSHKQGTHVLGEKTTSSASSNGNGNGSAGNGSGGNGNGKGSQPTLSIVGFAPSDVHAGASSPVDIKITNSNNFAISVTQIHVSSAFTLTKTLAGCTAADFSTADYTGPAITVASGGTFQLSVNKPDGVHTISSSLWPQVAMPPTARNQDGCQGAPFSLSYTATAVKA